MIILCFQLTMPRCNSWNGRWSDEERPHTKVLRFTHSSRFTSRLIDFRLEHHITDCHYDYEFGDGWTASVRVFDVTDDQASALEKASAGFAGYDWMIDSIVANNKIVVPVTH